MDFNKYFSYFGLLRPKYLSDLLLVKLVLVEVRLLLIVLELFELILNLSIEFDLDKLFLFCIKVSNLLFNLKFYTNPLSIIEESSTLSTFIVT